ncbi:bifunctional adenosylcobinamide kinase/adenosylcobinamide-phosphate guanylyltransferase [Chryseolinea lacunae]|uniref:Adenosylcobinamide kinase n=1 Tax=Chryseolinea lacunae TaxID=2801331 RepID=A0ABS1KP55_9BACT|nr:bifunctional adenosylcobinamide kinase/adenosylcobinamide-phosphate guanylyltransferase [Chryseolinea lacunae]MBL0741012.1 bifunctional adenosylcobinamide kinase/adenosylcobinamide-phosphate guanylyltransferase [Chryseolinea lacunae]
MQPRVIYISGGERSGKSRYAQDLALQLSPNPVYLATARKWDSDFEKRIARHQAERDARWTNVEEEKFISTLALQHRVVVMDCVTLWLTNIFADTKSNVDDALTFAKEELTKAFAAPCTWIIISNEIGMGVHAASEVGRKFVELQGWTNQFIAHHAHQAYFMVSGIPLLLKTSTPDAS